MSDPTPKRLAGTPRIIVVDDETDTTQLLKVAQ